MPTTAKRKAHQDADALRGLGPRIRALRDYYGWSQQELADRVGVSKGAVSLWENGLVQSMKINHLFRLADVFNVDIYRLTYGKDAPGNGGKSP